ncbi:hypothetical protein J1605_002792 [Eschrichtius robustus]|uniref:Uncharacterized protein n=1 Tax=Eschrichtius robustus TaxID=9764 RepID=A0AB34HY04_ESCRO|nr:hypothetical protein J1605_002792 [Eschrichtius robustus]
MTPFFSIVQIKITLFIFHYLIYRLAPSSFSTKHSLPIPSIVPSYMAMTAAAKRKRKLTSSTSNTSLSAEVNSGSAKRVHQDNSSDKHFQENRPTMAVKFNEWWKFFLNDTFTIFIYLFISSLEYKRNIHKVKPSMVRKFGRSISKGNLR